MNHHALTDLDLDGDPPEWLDPEDCTDEELGRGVPFAPELVARWRREDRQVREVWRWLPDDPLPESSAVAPDTVGSVLRAVRWRTGRSQRALAAAAGVSVAAVGRWEAAPSDPRLSTLVAVLATAGLRLAVVDDEGTQLAVPFDQDRRRDDGDRRLAAHRPQGSRRNRWATGLEPGPARSRPGAGPGPAVAPAPGPAPGHSTAAPG